MVLHISSDFPNQRIYYNLVTSLAHLGVEQFVYSPISHKSQIGKNANYNLTNVHYSYSQIITPKDRIHYFGKIKKTSSDLINNVPLQRIGLIHAHFLFSDGGVALRLKQNYNIPYVVAVRNTDLYYFFRYAIHLRKFGLKILDGASKIIFLSEAYKLKLIRDYTPKRYRDDFLKKSVTIPNGIDTFWLENLYKREVAPIENVRLLFVGELSKNKNVQGIIELIKKSRKDSLTFELDVVGDGEYRKALEKLSKTLKSVRFHGSIRDKDLLKKFYRESDIFVMVSRRETFGLVYVEAMTQGLPLIFTHGQGIDGYFAEGEVGYSVVYADCFDILRKIKLILESYLDISSRCTELSKAFSWRLVAEKYHSVYQEISHI